MMASAYSPIVQLTEKGQKKIINQTKRTQLDSKYDKNQKKAKNKLQKWVLIFNKLQEAENKDSPLFCV